jgi:hypothetical protein
MSRDSSAMKMMKMSLTLAVSVRGLASNITLPTIKTISNIAPTIIPIRIDL